MLMMGALRNHSLLPEAVIVFETVGGDVDSLSLVNTTGTGSFWSAIALPSTDEGRFTRRVSLFAYPGKGGQYPQRRRAILLPPLSRVDHHS